MFRCFKSQTPGLTTSQSRLVNCPNMWRFRGTRGFYIERKMSRHRNIIRSMQMFLIFVSLSPASATSANLDLSSSSTDHPPNSQNREDAVFINFPRKTNSSKTARQIYLPPEEQDFALPEVIDNRIRSSSGSSRPALSASAFPLFAGTPEIELRTPFENDERSSRFFSRPNSGRPRAQENALPVGYNANSANVGLEPSSKEFTTSGHVQIISMACQNSVEELFFRASLRSSRYTEYPIIEGIAGDNCRIERINDEYRINLTNELFWNCGIHDCSTDKDRYYCLNLRFPAIAGLRLNEDAKVTLRCKTQEKTVSHTRRLNIKTLDTSGRNAPRVETGGHKNAFETEVGLYRKTFGSGHLFDAKIEPGGTVILGEQVLLRTLVRVGDGWRYSRISDVTVHYVEKKRRSKIMNSLWILDANGCLNPDVREICSREQYRVSPLENYLMFEAFMFDNMKETDEMVMNVKITGCLDGGDCALNCPAGHSRRVRSVEADSQNNTVDWSDDITFRVIFPENRSDVSGSFVDSHLALTYVLSVVVLVTIVALLATIKTFHKRRIPKI